MSRCTVLALIALTLLPTSALAQSLDDYNAVPAYSYSVDVLGAMPESMTSLYVASVTLQGLDTITTFRALDAGHRERNPIFAGANKPLIITAKVAATSASIVLTRRLWRTNRKAAILSMVLTNAFMSAVVANNSEILDRTR